MGRSYKGIHIYFSCICSKNVPGMTGGVTCACVRGYVRVHGINTATV